MKNSCLIIFFFIFVKTLSQNNKNWNELTFAQHLKDKWTSEINLRLTNSSTFETGSPFEKRAQYMGRLWLHFNYNSRWKYSLSLAQFYNLEAPELDQRPSNEWRIAPQANYIIKKTNTIVNTRSRLEFRFIENSNTDYYGNGLRFRQQLKVLKPFNGKVIRKGTFYGVAADEIFFTLKSSLYDYKFDRNRFTLGSGYAISDDIKIEVNYMNDFLLGKNLRESTNIFSFNIFFNNLYKNLTKKK